MKLTKNITFSVEILAAHKLRTFLSVTGMVVGVASVVLMVAVGRGAEQRILDQIQGMGTHLIVVSAGQSRIVAGRRRQMSTVTTLVPGDAEVIAELCPSVSLAAPAVTKKLNVRADGETVNTEVNGMTREGMVIRNFTIATGRGFSEAEARAKRRVAVLGPTVAANLFGNSDPVGAQIRIGRVPFEVIGITHAKGIDQNGADQDDVIIVPLITAMRRLMNVSYVQSIYVQAQNSQLMTTAETEVRALLHERHRLRSKPDDFTVQNQATLLATERETAHTMTLLLGSVAGISLAVGGVGILAVMLIAVRERRREIGLRRALGARRRDIRLQFLTESVLLSGLGGGVGVAVGVGGAYGVAALGYWDTLVSWPSMIIALLVSVVLGVFFGIYPATRAAELEPIEALRSE